MWSWTLNKSTRCLVNIQFARHLIPFDAPSFIPDFLFQAFVRSCQLITVSNKDVVSKIVSIRPSIPRSAVYRCFFHTQGHMCWKVKVNIIVDKSNLLAERQTTVTHTSRTFYSSNQTNLHSFGGEAQRTWELHREKLWYMYMQYWCLYSFCAYTGEL